MKQNYPCVVPTEHLFVKTTNELGTLHDGMVVLISLRSTCRRMYDGVTFCTIMIVLIIMIKFQRQPRGLDPPVRLSRNDMFVFPSATGYHLPPILSQYRHDTTARFQGKRRRSYFYDTERQYNLNTNVARFTNSMVLFSSQSATVVTGRMSRSTLTTLSLFSDDSSRNDDIQAINSGSSTKRSTDFEYQEMKVILDALHREGIVASNRMDRNKANELNSYIQRIVSDRTTSKITSTSSMELDGNYRQRQQQRHSLWNTSWTMKYTTMDILPPDMTIQLQFFDAPSTTGALMTADTDLTARSTSKMKYRLLFGSKTFGLNALNVDCDCMPFSNYDNENMMQLSLTFDTITMDAFGFENVPLCFLSNLLVRNRNDRKDTINPSADIIINTVYMDDTIWIEQQQQQIPQDKSLKPYGATTSSLNDFQNVIWNVYQKDAAHEL